MGLFKRKKQSNVADTPDVQAEQVAQSIFDDAYRKELRKLGRQYFSKIITEDKEALRREFARTFTETSNDLRSYIRKQLSVAVDHIRQELSRQLDSQLLEHRRVMNEAQDNATQSLTRSSQELHERYSELSRTLERAVADQEAKMVAVFDKNEEYLNEMQRKQESAMEDFQTSADSIGDRVDKFQSRLDDLLQGFYRDISDLKSNQQRQAHDFEHAQGEALDSMKSSIKKLEEQNRSMEEMIDGVVEKQQNILMGTFNENMARVVEHYLLQALGDQFEVRDQLPAIMKQLEENKDAIIEDAKL